MNAKRNYLYRVLFTILMVVVFLFANFGISGGKVYAQEIQTDTPALESQLTEAPTLEPTLTETTTPVPADTETSTYVPTDTEVSTQLPTETETSVQEPTETEMSTLEPTETVTPTPEPTPTELPTEIKSQYFSVRPVILADGTTLVDTIINGPPHPPAGFSTHRATVTAFSSSAMTLSDVPAYNWVYGCSAVSASMIAGYYDRSGYANIYTGAANGGVAPLTEDSTWPTWIDGDGDVYPNNPLVASHQGVDGLTTHGSIDDYWTGYLSGLIDPYLTHGWTQHTWATAIGDYMKTSQYYYDNDDGSTQFWTYAGSKGSQKLTCSAMESSVVDDYGDTVAYFDGTYGRAAFYKARGYTVTDCYNQNTDNNYSSGFSLANFQSEINAGHPVLLNLYGHTIVGIGYDGSTIYVHDTWDSSTHTMTWGGSYAGMELLSVSVVNLALLPPLSPTLISPSGDTTVNKPTYTWNTSSVPNAFTPATSYVLKVTNTDNSTVALNQTVSTSSCSNGVCSIKPSTTLTGQNYKFEVAAANSGGQGDFSAPMTFKEVNNTPPAAPTLLGPSGTIYVLKPAYQWNTSVGSTGYMLKVTNADTNVVVIDTTVKTSSCKNGVCSNTPPNGLADGNYKFEVAATNSFGQSDFSTPMTFTDAYHTPPFTPTLLSSPSGTIYVFKPTYQWNPSGGSAPTGYILKVTNTDTNIVVINTTVKTSACNNGVCSTTPSAGLADGNYKFEVAAQNSFGQSDFSTSMMFTGAYHTPPFAPTLLEPNGTTYVLKPIYQWNSSGGSAPTGYILKVTNADTNVVVINTTVKTNACKNGICSTTPSTGLADGNYKFEVAAQNSFGQSDFSTPMIFSDAYHTPPFVPTLLGPNGMIYVLKPTYKWNSSGGSAPTGYVFKVTNTDTNVVVVNTTVKTSACKNGICSTMPSAGLADGNYQFEVAAQNSFGQSDFSTPLVFGEAYHTPPFTPVLLSPSGTVNVKRPVFKWNVPGGSVPTSYVLWIENTDSTITQIVTVKSSACKNGVCSYTSTGDLVNGNYQFMAQSQNSFGQSSFSAWMTFIVNH
jgi:hypothetical protein